MPDGKNLSNIKAVEHAHYLVGSVYSRLGLFRSLINPCSGVGLLPATRDKEITVKFRSWGKCILFVQNDRVQMENEQGISF